MRTILAALALASAAAPVSAAPRPAVDFANYTYSVTPCNPGRIRLHSGEGEQDVDETALDLYLEQVVFGELAPGRTYAVVRLSCSLPVGSSSAAYLYAIAAGRATYVRNIAEADPGEGHMESGWIHVRFANDLLYVDRCVSADDCVHGVVTTYAFRRGHVAAIYEMRHRYKM